MTGLAAALVLTLAEIPAAARLTEAAQMLSRTPAAMQLRSTGIDTAAGSRQRRVLDLGKPLGAVPPPRTVPLGTDRQARNDGVVTSRVRLRLKRPDVDGARPSHRARPAPLRRPRSSVPYVAVS
jgi:hypothetical protein